MIELYPQIEPYEQGFLEVDHGNRVYWETCGNPHGKPAVVLHGGPGSGCIPWHRRLFDPSGKCPETTTIFALKAAHVPPILHSGTRVSWESCSTPCILESNGGKKSPWHVGMMPNCKARGEEGWRHLVCLTSARASNGMVSVAQQRAHLFPFLLYHLLSTRTLPLWTIFFGVLSPILRRKRRASFAPALKALL